MLICDPCREKNFRNQRLITSFGRCEVCGIHKMCADIHSTQLESKHSAGLPEGQGGDDETIRALQAALHEWKSVATSLQQTANQLHTANQLLRDEVIRQRNILRGIEPLMSAFPAMPTDRWCSLSGQVKRTEQELLLAGITVTEGAQA